MIYVFYGAALLAALALCLTAYKNHRKFLFLGAFILPFHAVGVDIGVLLTLDKVFAWIGIFIIAISLRFSTPRRGWAYAFSAMVAYITLLTMVMFISGALTNRIDYAHSMGLGLGQSTLLLPVQLVSQLTIWFILVIGYVLGRPATVINGFIWGTLSNAFIGFYQVLAAVKGLPWLPPDVLTRLSGQDAGQFQVQHSDLYRLSGLAGEPKHAAALFVFALVLLMCFPIRGRVWKLAVLGLALLLTLSTAGWMAFAVIYAVFMFYRRKFVQMSIAAGLVFIMFAATQVNTTFAFIVDTRIVMRLADPGQFEPKDAALLDVAKHDPEIILTGAGAGGIDLFLMQWVRASILEKGGGGGATGPTYLLTNVIGDYGIIGFSLFASMLFSMARYFTGNLRAFYVTAVIALLLLPRFAAEPPVLLVLGSMMHALERRKQSVHAPSITHQEPGLSPNQCTA